MRHCEQFALRSRGYLEQQDTMTCAQRVWVLDGTGLLLCKPYGLCCRSLWCVGRA
jgi:hypothetical protein